MNRLAFLIFLALMGVGVVLIMADDGDGHPVHDGTGVLGQNLDLGPWPVEVCVYFQPDKPHPVEGVPSAWLVKATYTDGTEIESWFTELGEVDVVTWSPSALARVQEHALEMMEKPTDAR